MKHLTKFENQTLFDEAKDNLDKPHVSLTVDNNTVHYLEQQAPQPVVRPIQPGDRLSYYEGEYAEMPYNTWFLLRNSVRVEDQYGSLIVRRRSLDDNVEVAGATGDRNVFRVVFGEEVNSVFVVNELSEEFTDEVTEGDSVLEDIWKEWGGLRYYIVNELQPHVEQWFEI